MLDNDDVIMMSNISFFLITKSSIDSNISDTLSSYFSNFVNQRNV